MIVSTHDSVEVGFHELLVEIHLIKVPIRAQDYVHVIQASDLYPTTRVGREGERMRTTQSCQKRQRKRNVHSCVGGNDATILMIRRGGRATEVISKRIFVQYTIIGRVRGEKARRAEGGKEEKRPSRQKEAKMFKKTAYLISRKHLFVRIL
jgi:hypothetical protein